MSDPRALTHKEVLDVYVDHLSGLITSKVAAFERQLGASLSPMLDALEEALEARGTPLGGKDAQAPKREAQLQILEELTAKAIEAARRKSPELISTAQDSASEAAPLSVNSSGAFCSNNAEDVPPECLALPV